MKWYTAEFYKTGVVNGLPNQDCPYKNGLFKQGIKFYETQIQRGGNRRT